MLKLALRSLLRHRVRNALTLGTVALGVIALILSGGFVEDVFVQLREVTIHSQLGHIQIHREGFFEFGRREPSAYLISEPGRLTTTLSAADRVKRAAERLQFSGLLSNGRAEHSIFGQGVEADKEAALGTSMTFIEGRNLTDDDNYGIIVGQGVAGALDLEIGSYVSLNANTLNGALNSLEFEVLGVFQTFAKDFDDRAVRITLGAARELLDTERAHAIVLELEDTADTDPMAAALRRDLAGKGYDVLTWFDMADFYRSTVAMYKRQFAVLQIIILVMVVLGVANSINMAIFERVGEFGTQMALGDPRGALFRQIMTEATLLGIVGAILGGLLGVGLAHAISAVGIPMPPPPNANTGYTAMIRVVPGVVAQALVVGLLATVLAAIVPARRSSQLPIVEALRQNV